MQKQWLRKLCQDMIRKIDKRKTVGFLHSTLKRSSLGSEVAVFEYVVNRHLYVIKHRTQILLQYAGAKGELVASWKRRHSAGKMRNVGEEAIFDWPSHCWQPCVWAKRRLRYVPERIEVSQLISNDANDRRTLREKEKLTTHRTLAQFFKLCDCISLVFCAVSSNYDNKLICRYILY